MSDDLDRREWWKQHKLDQRAWRSTRPRRFVPIPPVKQYGTHGLPIGGITPMASPGRNRLKRRARAREVSS